MSDTKLAIDGGTPVRNKETLPYGHQQVDDADIQAVVDVLRGDWLTTGPAVDAYEKAFAEYVGAKYAVAVSSGTAALHTAAHVAGICDNDEVITSPLSFAASANCVLYCGGRPVFADVQPETGNIDPAKVEALINKNTKAIIAVDYAGQPADYDELITIAKRHGLVLIDDAAQALGSSYKGSRIGSIVPLTTFSTHPVKSVATGEGGVITTDDPEMAEHLRTFRSHGITTDARAREKSGDWFYEMKDLGYNYRIPDILCALGKSQLTKLDDWIDRRHVIAKQYDEVFADIAAVHPLTIKEDRETARHLYVIRLDPDLLKVDRRQVFKALRAEGIGVNVHHIPVYLHPYYQDLGYQKMLCPETEKLYERIITLPLWPGMNEEDVLDTINAVEKVISAYCR